MFVYQKIIEDVHHKITNRELKPGDRLISEREMMQFYQVSDTSVRKALRQLSESGVIVKRHGSGNYIAKHLPLRQLSGGKVDAVIALHGPISMFAPVSKYFADCLLPLKKVNTVLRKFSEDITPEQLRALKLEFGNVPILAFNSRNHTAKAAQAGLLRNLEDLPVFPEYLDSLPGNLRWKFVGPESFMHYYGAPFFYTLSCLGINAELAAAAGINPDAPIADWQELLRRCREFKAWKNQANGYPLYATFGYRRQFTYSNGRAFFFMSCDGQPYGSDYALIERGVRRYLEFVHTLIRENLIEAVGIQSPDPFVNGNYLFHLHAASWLPRDLANFRPGLDCRYHPYPVPQPGMSRYSSNGTTLLSVIDSGSTDDALLRDILDCLMRPESQKNLAEKLGMFPAAQGVFQQMCRENPQLGGFANSVFTSLEPHFLYDSVCEVRLDEIIVRFFDNPECNIEPFVKEYMDFYRNIKET